MKEILTDVFDDITESSVKLTDSDFNALFISKIKSTNGLRLDYSDFNMLSNNGFVKTDLKLYAVYNFLKNLDIDLMSEEENVKKTTYIKEFNGFNLMLLVGTITHYNNMRLIQDSFIVGRFILDKNNQILKNNNNDPSIYLYIRDGQKLSSNIVVDMFFVFNENYYSIVEVENYDYHTNKYNMAFYTYENKFLSFCCNSSYSVRKNQIIWILNGKKYDLNLILKLLPNLNEKPIDDLIDYRQLLSSDEINLLEMMLL